MRRGCPIFFLNFMLGEQQERSVARTQQQRETTEHNNNGVSTGGGVWQDTVRLWFTRLKLGVWGGGVECLGVGNLKN